MGIQYLNSGSSVSSSSLLCVFCWKLYSRCWTYQAKTVTYSAQPGPTTSMCGLVGSFQVSQNSEETDSVLRSGTLPLDSSWQIGQHTLENQITTVPTGIVKSFLCYSAHKIWNSFLPHKSLRCWPTCTCISSHICRWTWNKNQTERTLRFDVSVLPFWPKLCRVSFSVFVFFIIFSRSLQWISYVRHLVRRIFVVFSHATWRLWVREKATRKTRMHFKRMRNQHVGERQKSETRVTPA